MAMSHIYIYIYTDLLGIINLLSLFSLFTFKLISSSLLLQCLTSGLLQVPFDPVHGEQNENNLPSSIK